MIRAAALWLCLLTAATGQAAAIRLVDDAGMRLELAHAPQRIVSLTPHLTELLFAVGAGAQLPGEDSASDHTAAARALPRVGDSSRVNLERILALKPDLVVVWMGGNRAADIHALKALGLPVLHTRAARLDDVPRLFRLIGRASGHAEAGDAAAEDFAAQLAALGRRYARGKNVSVFYQVWDRPLMTVGGRHWISDALTLCGTRNVFADLHAASPVVAREAVLKRAPQLIVSGSDASDVRGFWRRFGNLPAVRNGAFVRVDADRLHRPAPRLVEGVAELCAAVASYR
jgi:iron complex transport system substrate-binding protein